MFTMGLIFLLHTVHFLINQLTFRERWKPSNRLLMRQLKIDVLSVLVVTDKLMFGVVGARDFSPEITVLPIGTEVPCSDRVPPQIPIYR